MKQVCRLICVLIALGLPIQSVAWAMGHACSHHSTQTLVVQTVTEQPSDEAQQAHCHDHGLNSSTHHPAKVQTDSGNCNCPHVSVGHGLVFNPANVGLRTDLTSALSGVFEDTPIDPPQTRLDRPPISLV